MPSCLDESVSTKMISSNIGTLNVKQHRGLSSDLRHSWSVLQDFIVAEVQQLRVGGVILR